MRILFCIESPTKYHEVITLVKAFALKKHNCFVLLPHDANQSFLTTADKSNLEALHERHIITEIIPIGLEGLTEKSSSSDEKLINILVWGLRHPFKFLRALFRRLLKTLQKPTNTRANRLVQFVRHRFKLLSALFRRLVKTLQNPTNTRANTLVQFVRHEFKLLSVLVRRLWKYTYRTVYKLYCRFHDGWDRYIGRRLKINQYVYMQYKCFLDNTRHTFAAHAFDVVVLPEETVGMVASSIVKASREQHIPVIVCPYTTANQDEAFQNLKDRDEFKTDHNSLAAFLFPRWRMKRQGRDLVRLPESHIIAHERLGLTPQDPWLMNSGTIDAICVENQSIKDYFVSSGISTKRLRVTGSAALDEMYNIKTNREIVSAKLNEEAGASDDRPLLLVSGCPNQLTGVEAPYCAYSSMEEIATVVANALTSLKSTYRFVVRPHPAHLAFGDMLARYGFHVSELPTAQLVVLSDLFIAFASSTIRWAVCCGVPTINYDVFSYNFNEYRDNVGVFDVKTSTELSILAARLRFGSKFYRDTLTRIASEEAAIVMLDGKSVTRLETTLNELTVNRGGS